MKTSGPCNMEAWSMVLQHLTAIVIDGGVELYVWMYGLNYVYGMVLSKRKHKQVLEIEEQRVRPSVPYSVTC